ncbi:DUF3611 family protein [Synechococcus sp. PCC 7336]|uniref:DUF3611 family protein n=1 Tax=Synechococcus sp. PCC 7336 TaxID=195250 RepID=UPI00034AEF90|nr:DUF3611 family protein [Synechococcus sp. PCC 7336]
MANDANHPLFPLFSHLKLAYTFRLAGWLGFWSQLVLAIAAASILMFSSEREAINHPGTRFSLFLASAALIVLFAGVLVKVLEILAGRQLRSVDRQRWPAIRKLIRLLDFDVILSWVGMVLAIGGTISILVALMSVAMTLVPGIISDAQRTIQPLDLLVIQSMIFIVAGHFVGISTSLWILRGLLLADRHPSEEPHRPSLLPPGKPSQPHHPEPHPRPHGE